MAAVRRTRCGQCRRFIERYDGAREVHREHRRGEQRAGRLGDERGRVAGGVGLYEDEGLASDLRTCPRYVRQLTSKPSSLITLSSCSTLSQLILLVGVLWIKRAMSLRSDWGTSWRVPWSRESASVGKNLRDDEREVPVKVLLTDFNL